jgi:hypothetical protein
MCMGYDTDLFMGLSIPCDAVHQFDHYDRTDNYCLTVST